MVKKAYPCTVTGCDKVFPMAFELKKHLALHKDPNSVYFCTECDFITLQKKNLGIHVAIHTGETPHHCPHILSVGPGIERCDFKTNDPAALTKHRKKVHAYVPVRGRKSAPAPFSKWKVLEGARRLRAPYKPPLEVAPYKPSSRSSDVASSTARAPDASDDPSLQVTKENVDARVDPPLSTDTCPIQSWLNSTDVFGRPIRADASGDNPTGQDPGPSSSLDVFGDHVRDIWAETEAMMRSTSLAPLDASVPHSWDAFPQSSSAASLLSVYGGDPSWAKTEAQMRSTSLDPVDMSMRHPWAEPDTGTSANALHPWAEPAACMPLAHSNVFGGHPRAEKNVPRPSTSAVTLNASGTWLPQPGNPPALRGHADAPAFDPMYNAYILTGASVAPKHGMDLDNIYDPTLSADWMAAYEYSYTHPGPTGNTEVVDPVQPSLVPDTRTGREGCFCPEWMTEAGVEGWDQGVVDAHKGSYTF